MSAGEEDVMRNQADPIPGEQRLELGATKPKSKVVIGVGGSSSGSWWTMAKREDFTAAAKAKPR